MNDRVRLAKYLFFLDAVLGILSIGGAALYGSAYSSKSVWVAFFPVFVPFSTLWALFCYGAYKGLTSPNAFSQSCVLAIWSRGMFLPSQLGLQFPAHASGFGVACPHIQTAAKAASSPNKRFQPTRLNRGVSRHRDVSCLP